MGVGRAEKDGALMPGMKPGATCKLRMPGLAANTAAVLKTRTLLGATK
jgi:hypothetical protein